MMGNLAAAGMDPAAAAEIQKRQRILAALNGQKPEFMPQNAGQGLAAIGNAISDRQDQLAASFPQTPGGGQADWATNFRNLFTFGKNGGLY